MQGLQGGLLQALSVVEAAHLDQPEAQPAGAAQRLPLIAFGLVLFHAIVQVCFSCMCWCLLLHQGTAQLSAAHSWPMQPRCQMTCSSSTPC